MKGLELFRFMLRTIRIRASGVVIGSGTIRQWALQHKNAIISREMNNLVTELQKLPQNNPFKIFHDKNCFLMQKENLFLLSKIRIPFFNTFKKLKLSKYVQMGFFESKEIFESFAVKFME